MKRDLNARLASLVNDILERLRAEKDISSAFALAEWLATLLWKNHSEIYRLDELEIILLEKLPPLPATPIEPSTTEIHLATEVYRSGGHTPLMAHLIRHAQRPVEALLTRMSDVQLAAQLLELPQSQVHNAAREGDPVARVHALARHLSRCAQVIVSIHPNDVLGAVALRMTKAIRPDLPIGFMNHADHVFSVGIGVCDHVFEISAYGWGLREARGTTRSSSFVGIPIQPKTATASQATPNQAPPQVLTGGSPYKFRPLPGLSLPPVLMALLKRHPTARLTVLGPKSRDWWWWPLRAAHRRRVRVRQALPKEQYQQVLRDCTIYVDSHPIPGGTALPEALMAGRNIAGIRGVVWGYSCADELLDATPGAFLVSCEQLIGAAEPALSRQQDMRARCADWHEPASVRTRLDATWSGARNVPPIAAGKGLPDARPLERLWSRSGKLNHPGRRECPLKQPDLQWLAHRHLIRFGVHSWTTLKIMFYAYIRS